MQFVFDGFWPQTTTALLYWKTATFLKTHTSLVLKQMVRAPVISADWNLISSREHIKSIWGENNTFLTIFIFIQQSFLGVFSKELNPVSVILLMPRLGSLLQWKSIVFFFTDYIVKKTRMMVLVILGLAKTSNKLRNLCFVLVMLLGFLYWEKESHTFLLSFRTVIFYKVQTCFI